MGLPAKKNEDASKEFALEVEGDEAEWGKMQYGVLTSVSLKRYEEALKLIAEYKVVKFSFPPFKKRTEKILVLCEEHIAAIKNKLGIPNLAGMLAAKQEEVFESARENWQHLNSLLRRLRAIEKEFASADAKSSLIVIKAIMFSAIIILTTFLVKETFRTVGGSFTKLFTDTSSLLMKLLGS